VLEAWAGAVGTVRIAFNLDFEDLVESAAAIRRKEKVEDLASCRLRVLIQQPRAANRREAADSIKPST